MTLSSMTGFARADGEFEESRWTWEIKSVNGRGLELRFRFPPGFDFLDPGLRKKAKDKLSRGSLNVHLNLRRDTAEASYRLNSKALSSALAMMETVKLKVECAPPRAEAILSLKGVMEPVEEEDSAEALAALGEKLTQSFEAALTSLQAARLDEGKSLYTVIDQRLSDIEALSKQAREKADNSPEALRDKIAAQLEALIGSAGITEDRLAQEAALLAVKADVSEELDRLDAHVEAGRALLKDKGPVGRSLDFLSQEFNREANTFCSKVQDMALKQIGLEMKKVIDQMREQVQNVE